MAGDTAAGGSSAAAAGASSSSSGGSGAAASGGSSTAASGGSSTAASGSSSASASGGSSGAATAAHGHAAHHAVHHIPDPLFHTHIAYSHMSLPHWLGGGALTGKTVLSACFVGAAAGIAVGMAVGVVATCVVRRVVCDGMRCCCGDCCGGWCACDPAPGKEATCGGRCREPRCRGHNAGDCPERDACLRGCCAGAACGCAVAGTLGWLGTMGAAPTCVGDALSHRQQCFDAYVGGAVGGGIGCCDALATREMADKNDPDGKKETFWWF
eukprot:TRINITY_DN9731_c0_g1_i1.p1 TRINITY_DN9731_c0_g1~~TRINITY_DN9731_c0_g1_i1.p1  ORF type:complete len:269 (+),score=64.69 TRINITY_DN9731_c0_g1_i1:73-879(+)